MKRLQVHRTLYIVLLCVLVMALPTSNFVMNMAWVFLGVNWLVEGGFKSKFSNFHTNYLLQAFFVLMAVHLLWLIPSSNMAYGLNDIRQKLPLLVVPLVVLTSKPLQPKEQHWIFLCYLTSLTVVSVIGLVRYYTIPNLPYRDVIPYISHIRFSLNLCLASILLLYAIWRHRSSPHHYVFSFVAVFFLLLFVFLLFPVLRSYTALVTFILLFGVLFIVFWNRFNTRIRWAAILLVLLAVGGSALTYCSVSRHYYRPCALLQQPRHAFTANGNPYTFSEDGLMENGNFIAYYVCEPELRSAWTIVSRVPIDSVTDNGYAIYYTLIRYLNALGCAKDSAAVVALSPDDVQAIEHGVANPYYEHSSFIRRSIYAFLFERDNARLFGNIRNFSFGERSELWRCGWQVFLQHPLFGTGTGDGVDDLHHYLNNSQSQLRGTNKHIHNQYLTFLVSFGLLGMALILFFFLRAWLFCHPSRSLLLTAIITISLVSFISEDTLETLAGVLFIVTFLSLFSNDSKINT